MDVPLRHTLCADDAAPLASMYVISLWVVRPNAHAQYAVPSCSLSALLTLDREEAVGVQWADSADASEEPLSVVSESLR